MSGGEGWRPIAEAPKDGTHFLGATFDARYTPNWRIAVMWWDDEFETTGWNEETESPGYRGGWCAGRVGSWSYEEYAEEEPTHFMPLPLSPKDPSS